MPTILIVDDDPDIRLLLRLELSAEGFDILETGDGEAGLAALAAHAPDLVLLDMMMPVLDGWGVLRAIDHSTAPPVIVVTALTTRDEQHQAELIELGAFDIVMKPFDPGWLLDLVTQALRLDEAGRAAYRQERLRSFRRGPGGPG